MRLSEFRLVCRRRNTNCHTHRPQSCESCSIFLIRREFVSANGLTHLDPLGDPVASESDKNNQPDDSAAGTPSFCITSRIRCISRAARHVGCVNTNQSTTEVCAECNTCNTTEEADDKDVNALHPRNIHCLLEHANRERDSGDPADEADNGEYCEDGEDNSGSPQMSDEVIYRCADGEDAVENSSQPNEELGEGSCSQKVCPREYKAHDKDEYKENDCVGVEGEIILVAIDSSTDQGMIFRVSVERDTADSNEAQEGRNE